METLDEMTNFKDFSLNEYKENLKRLGVNSHFELIGRKCYYVKQSYGIHEILNFNPGIGEFLLCLDGDRFYTLPFRITLI